MNWLQENPNPVDLWGTYTLNCLKSGLLTMTRVHLIIVGLVMKGYYGSALSTGNILQQLLIGQMEGDVESVDTRKLVIIRLLL